MSLIADTIAGNEQGGLKVVLFLQKQKLAQAEAF
jgi:hypothetical protein